MRVNESKTLGSQLWSFMFSQNEKENHFWLNLLSLKLNSLLFAAPALKSTTWHLIRSYWSMFIVFIAAKYGLSELNCFLATP